MINMKGHIITIRAWVWNKKYRLRKTSRIVKAVKSTNPQQLIFLMKLFKIALYLASIHLLYPEKIKYKELIL